MGNKENESREDESREDESREDESREDESREDESREDEFREDEFREDESREDEFREDEFREDESREDESREDESREDELREDESRKGKDKDKCRKQKKEFEKYQEKAEEHLREYLTCKSREKNNSDLIFTPATSIPPISPNGRISLLSGGISVVINFFPGTTRQRGGDGDLRFDADLRDASDIWGFPVTRAMPDNGLGTNLGLNQLPTGGADFTQARRIREQMTVNGALLDPRVVTVWYGNFTTTGTVIGRAFSNVPELNPVDPANPKYYQHIFLDNEGANGENNSLFAHELGHILYSTALGPGGRLLNDPTDPTAGIGADLLSILIRSGGLGNVPFEIDIHSPDELTFSNPRFPSGQPLFTLPNPNVMNSTPNNKTRLLASQLEKARRSFLFPENVQRG